MVCTLGMMTAGAQNSSVNDTLLEGFASRTATDFVEYWNTKLPSFQPKRNITLITTINSKLMPDTINGLPVRVFSDFDDLRMKWHYFFYKELLEERIRDLQ